MKFLVIIFLSLFLSGCAGARLLHNSKGEVIGIQQSGIFPVKAKIGDNEIDSKITLLDLNISGINSKG